MKKTTLLYIGLITTSANAMLKDQFKCTIPKNDGTSDDIVYVNDDKGNKIVETYDSYNRSFEGSKNDNDAGHNIRIQRPLLMQLCVQASKTISFDQKPFLELLQKISNTTFPSDQDSILMTKKDVTYRLLSYIPMGKYHSLVNNKKVEILWCGFETEQDKIDNNIKYPEKSEDSLFPDDSDEEEFYSHSSRGRDLKRSGWDIVTMKYDFRKDKQHHEKICLEFQALIKKLKQ